ncbi:PDDEXK-like family protein [Epilithonimonas tenax]|uniref:PDDEXK-like family protein n=1 Tax=Epilithonimonas tenax TaxID=191577 RepID=UPI000410466E|nr:PD-(D/E)XK nuclease family protein [Epilithonimonas tenax]
MNNHELLLEGTSGIIKNFYHSRDINGELFNLYSLLGIEHRENETHSVLLTDLLSPKGSHGQKGKFLQLFFEALNVEVEITEYAKVSREFYIGKIDENYTKGGRIDILIEIDDKKWIIENKLYAKDQRNQLERYYNKFPNATILYLTLDGKEYHNKIEFDVRKISYEETILKWLEKILDEIKDKEYLSNSIKQYYNLIKNITFKGFTLEMQENIENEIIKSAENLESAFEIYNNYENATTKLLSNTLKKNRSFAFKSIKLRNRIG